jgi:hypothetical protein
MNRIVLARVALVALALGGFSGVAFAAGETPSPLARSILSPAVPPQAQAGQSKAEAVKAKAATGKAKGAAKRRPAPPRRALSERGYIVGIRAADLARKLPERIVVAIGKKTVEIAVESGTSVKGAKGRAVAASRLRKGERVMVGYKPRGRRMKADSITILS